MRTPLPPVWKGKVPAVPHEGANAGGRGCASNRRADEGVLRRLRCPGAPTRSATARRLLLLLLDELVELGELRVDHLRVRQLVLHHFQRLEPVAGDADDDALVLGD